MAGLLGNRQGHLSEKSVLLSMWIVDPTAFEQD